MNISSLLQGVMGEQLIEGAVSQLGIENKNTKKAIAVGVPLLLAALKRNSKSSDGANGIFGALNKHDGSLLDNIGDLFGNNSSAHQQDGMSILGHILGNNKDNVANQVSKQSGVSPKKVLSILAMLAPVVMAMVGKNKNQKNTDSSGLSDMIGGLLGDVQNNNAKEMSGLERILDQDGDGNAMDDVMDIGSKLLGGLFGK